MSGATEIYLCRPGQNLKEGRVEYSNEIDTKEQAHADALQRCQWDKRLAKVAYYAVSENGDFKVILTYNNPHIESKAEKPKKVKKKPVPKPGLVKRVINAVTGSGSKKKKQKKKKKT